jgi:peptide deformylase
MSLLKIARMGHPILRRRAAPVVDPTAPDIRRLAQDMLETMRDAPGVGLAAPQVYASVRMVVVRVPPDRAGGQCEPETVLINPEITPLDANDAFGWEGCLSVPGLRGVVPRHRHIGLRALDLTGKVIEREATGFFARVIQHETDHLDGLLYLDRMPDLKLLAYDAEARHIEEEETD